MNAHAHVDMVYKQPSIGLKSARRQEYDLFARITGRMQTASKGLPLSFPELASSLDENRKLWVALAADVALPQNGLSADLRLQILNLAQFTLSHTARILSGHANISPLVDINLAVMKGLSGKGTNT